MPTSGTPAASTALPQPPRTSHAVPRNSANHFRTMSVLPPEMTPAWPRAPVAAIGPWGEERRRGPARATVGSAAVLRLASMPDPRFDNRFARELPGDPEQGPRLRQVPAAFYSYVEPTPVATPRL